MTDTKPMQGLAAYLRCEARNYGKRDLNYETLMTWAAEVEAATAPQPVQEPVLWQYRWLNPGKNSAITLDELDWKQVKPRSTESVEARIAELSFYRYFSPVDKAAHVSRWSKRIGMRLLATQRENFQRYLRNRAFVVT